MSRTLIAVVAGLIGLSAAVALYFGLVTAVPLVDWGADETDRLRAAGARQVRFASLAAVAAGALLLVGRAWKAGTVTVAAAVLLGLLAGANTVVSWALLLVYLLALLIGCSVLARRPRD